MRIGMLYTRLRTEERMLLDAFTRLGVEAEPIDVRGIVFDPRDPGEWSGYDAIVDRCVSLTAGINAARILERFRIPCLNRADVTEVCADKLRTTLALEAAGVPTPETRVAVGDEGAMGAVEAIGFPAVLKPTVGSWGRMVSRLNDRDAAEAVLEHRAALGGMAQQVTYVQEHIDKPGRDLRVFVVGGEAIAGIARSSEHWVTNTARGGTTSSIDVSGEMGRLSEAAAEAVGASDGVVAVDLLECPEHGPLVNEVNHSMEFRNSVDTTGVDIPSRVAGFVLEMARSHAAGVTQ